MKFADEFDQDHVPEWRDKYFDYKTGKRLVKALQRAINRTNGVTDPRSLFTNTVAAAFPSHKHAYEATNDSDDGDQTPLRTSAARPGLAQDDTTTSGALGGRMARGSLPTRESEDSEHDAGYQIATEQSNSPPRRVMFQEPEDTISPLARARSPPHSRDGIRQSLQPLDIPAGTHMNKMRATAAVAQQRAEETPRPGKIRRFPTEFQFNRVATAKIESHTHPIEMLNLRERELVTFLDSEVHKVDKFFQQKEKEAGKRLQDIREQLHIMRDRRNEELRGTKFGLKDESGVKKSRRSSVKTMLVREKSQSRALQTLPFTPVQPRTDPKQYEYADFARRPIENTQISYRTAKQKLRIAVQEYYRELEYLKSFSLLNRTAFRKLNKKYEKTLDPNARPTFRWFNENVDPSHFVSSNLVEEYLEAAEDLYSRYFERGNHKLAVSKLREITKPHGDKSESALLNGLLVGIGLVFAVEGVWDGVEKLSDDDSEIREQAVYLLQLYAGYFLMLYLFTWFCICCRIWTAYKVNYPFVFEFDTRNDLDWRQLSNFPCIFWLMFGVTIWLNFAKWWEWGSENLFLWYPLILFGATLIMIFLPLPVFRWRSRRWFAIAHWRLLCSGLYPVEFRDFFLGDMYCSLIYAVANAELFFCVYITAWDQPRRCGSHFSRLMGALAAIPPFWRAMQCLRRFVDTRNAFPHLANLVKYLLTVGVAIILAMYRIDNDWVEREIYIFLAVINSLYAALWDVFMDFSLLQEGARFIGLRNVLAFDMPWLYYAILVLDPLLRFCWIPLVIFTHDLQRASVVAFIVAFAEATRRGMWTLFRVENEHCTNIGSLKASRVILLPYKFVATSYDADRDERSSAVELEPLSRPGESTQSKPEADTPLMEAGQAGFGLSKLRRRTTLGALSRKLAEAHKQDFQKKKKRGTEDADAVAVHGVRREQGIELALQEDEDSDDDLDEASNASDAGPQVTEREVDARASVDNVLVDRESIVSSPQHTNRS